LYEKSSWHIGVPAGGNGNANNRKKARASSGRSPAEIEGKSETSEFGGHHWNILKAKDLRGLIELIQLSRRTVKTQ
jgi:hypothetical protein